MSKFEFIPTTLKQLLTTRYFSVPRYQRSYSWTTDEIEDFWIDVYAAADHSNEYFLGNIVLTVDADLAGTHSIIDGQQRLATTTILLAAMRDAYRSNGKNNVADAIQTNEIYPLDTSTYEQTPRVRLNAVDNPFYEQLILNGECPAADKDSHQLIQAAKNWFDEKIEKLCIDNPTNWASELGKISKFLKDRARVVAVYAETDADAFVIFETLNDRGADLTIADLLKNFLFSKAGNEIDTVQSNWIESTVILEEHQGSDQFITFLRHYWSSVHGLTRERELYRSIKSSVTGKPSALKLSADLKKAARLYGAAVSSESDFWQGYSEQTKNVIRLLPRVKLEQNRPLLLSILQHFDKSEIEKTLQSLLNWSIRGLVGGVMGKGSSESAFCEAATEIRAGNIKNSADLRNSLGALIPGDTSFMKSVETFRTTNSALARYMLLAIERAILSQNEPEFIPNSNVDEVNLEHILPQRAKKTEWPQFEPDEVNFYAPRIANMTLLAKGKNSKIGNKSWDIKRSVIGGSEFRLNAIVSGYDLWNKESIDARGRSLAEIAPVVWPL